MPRLIIYAMKGYSCNWLIRPAVGSATFSRTHSTMKIKSYFDNLYRLIRQLPVISFSLLILLSSQGYLYKTPSLGSVCLRSRGEEINIHKCLLIWAKTCDFKQCGILTRVDSDEPVHPPFKLRYSKWCSVSRLTIKEYSSDQQRLWSVCAYAYADLSLCWSHIPHCWKSHVVVHIRIWNPMHRIENKAFKPV